MHYAIVVQVECRPVVRLARYHLRKPTAPALIDRKFPGLYNARRDSLGRYWKSQFSHTNALMLAESF